MGAAVSRTGAHEDLAADYGKGIELWVEQANAAGGLLGRRVELRLMDDGSEAGRAAALYRQLIRERADALIGPYGTAATLVAAAEAESAQRVLVNGAGWSRAVHRRTPRFVFQSAVPYNAYAGPLLALLQRSGLKRALLLARDEPASLEMAQAAADAARKLGISVGETLTYAPDATDFAPLIAKARAADAQAWIAFGGVADAAEMVKSFRKNDYAPPLVYLRGAADPRFLELVGQDAEYITGSSAWTPARPGTQAFAAAFAQKWQRPPTTAAAEGYAAGQVLGEGLRRAGSTDARAVRAALASMSVETVLGTYKADPATGEQVGARPPVVQVLRGRREIVAPESIATAKLVLPYPAWSERVLLK